MENARIVRFLRCGASDVIDLAIEKAGLTYREALAVKFVGRLGMSQSAAAEYIEAQHLMESCSVDSMHLWHKSAMQKLSRAWDGCWWIGIMADY